ncbi:NAD-dependent succinate-semialdehyde dehydrogenase [Psychroflexus lacisalsi]|jgi:succinate-semialdehyde dehydrogenase/glutarate-semialdehyde dehydrogenase|uniref:NAD-dependent succinate-semialdehyde dehydrogenase n=1 Tax=Psychroflexus lacisalsi TaxID=503928 RepID=A0ABP3VHX7_9FLAO|nr:NAD-dependent succinate-semialdehyde dehydrogenase [Psychroflexus lacisalsi]MBZ9619591.1 NAD-dependent succinate-semialdehyde dehydrogenase [Psychroflexus lacisalsi]
MKFQSKNPFNGDHIAEYTTLTTEELNGKLEASAEAFKHWKTTPLIERTDLLKKAGQILRDNLDEYAEIITLEMGKPISESKSEVNKCAWVCDYYSEHAEEFLAIETIETDASRSFVRHDPIGAVFAVMPWNFPFWQVFRFAAPTLTAGNTGLLKHAPNVFGCAQKIEEVFLKAGYPKGVFQNLIVHHDETEKIVSHDTVRAITLTGSEAAGSAVSQIASKYIKKSLLELGGSNSFIVLDDADLDKVVNTAVQARMMNSGQSCIAAKRFIVMDSIYDEFVSRFIEKAKQLKVGDPISEDTQIGTLARKDLADKLQKQVQDSIKQGAKLLLGGKQNECFHEPTVLGEVTSEMAAFKEETFGPLAAMIKVKSADEAFELAEQSKFGLGLSVFTKDIDKALSYSDKVSDGAFFVNELVKSDPRLPFGGTKTSGFGRELAKDGIMEFINRKAVYVKA